MDTLRAKLPDSLRGCSELRLLQLLAHTRASSTRASLSFGHISHSSKQSAEKNTESGRTLFTVGLSRQEGIRGRIHSPGLNAQSMTEPSRVVPFDFRPIYST